MKRRSFYAKAVTRIAPKVVEMKTRYTRRIKHRNKYDE